MKVENHLISLWNGGEERKTLIFIFFQRKKKHRGIKSRFPLTCKTRAHNKQKENLGAHEEKIIYILLEGALQII
jgi:hypothetical protein